MPPFARPLWTVAIIIDIMSFLAPSILFLHLFLVVLKLFNWIWMFILWIFVYSFLLIGLRGVRLLVCFFVHVYIILNLIIKILIINWSQLFIYCKFFPFCPVDWVHDYFIWVYTSDAFSLIFGFILDFEN